MALNWNGPVLLIHSDNISTRPTSYIRYDQVTPSEALIKLRKILSRWISSSSGTIIRNSAACLICNWTQSAKSPMSNSWMPSTTLLKAGSPSLCPWWNTGIDSLPKHGIHLSSLDSVSTVYISIHRQLHFNVA